MAGTLCRIPAFIKVSLVVYLFLHYVLRNTFLFIIDSDHI